MEKFIQKATGTLIFALPILLLNLRAWAVLCFVLLIFISFLFLVTNKEPAAFKTQEKTVSWFFMAAFLSTLLTYLLGNFTFDETTNLVHNLAFLGFVPVYILIKKNGLPQHAFWYGMIVGSFLSCITALIEVTILDRSHATGAHHRIIYGDHALLLGMMCLLSYSYFRTKGKVYLVFPFLGFLFGLTTSVLSHARGGWIAIPVFLVILALFFKELGSIRTRVVYSTVFILSMLTAYAIPQTGIKHRMELAVQDIQDYRQRQNKESSVGVRFEMWRASKELAKDNPVTGIGLRQYPIRIKELVEMSDRYEKTVANYAHPHNEYLNALVERGVIGLASILLILIYPAYLFYRTLRNNEETVHPLAIAGLIVTCGYMIFGLTEAIFNRPTTANFYTMIMALLLGGIYARPGTRTHGSEPGPAAR